MPSFMIPDSGLTIGGAPAQNASPAVDIVGLTLADSVIEEMIRCVQNGNLIQLCLGESPNINISYGSKLQHLSASDDPFTTEIFESDTTNSNSTIPAYSNTAFNRSLGLVGRKFAGGPSTAKSRTTAVPIQVPSETAGADAALAALQNSLASENAKKAENTTKYIKTGLPLPGKRGAAGKQTSKSKFLSQNRSLNNDATRSMPVSPAMSGVGSPALGPTSVVPLSQQQAELARAARKPVIHLLAAQPWTEIGLREEVPNVSKDELKQALQKVGDLDSATGKWELRKQFYKELDVWAFEYSQVNDRQRAIDNAVKVFDKMRLGISDPQWEKLLPRNERGTGKCLSKLQAQIAAGPVPRAPKINVSKAGDSERDTPNGEEEDSSDKSLSKSKEESVARSVSQPPATKPKKTSEKEAQAKRLSKKPAAKPAPKAAPTKKAVQPKAGTKILSSEYVQDSDADEEDYPPPVKPLLPRPSIQKRPREDPHDDADTSDSSIPLSKKAKKENPPPHRISDASQNSRTTNSSTYSTTSSKNKSNSPQKSSPLASSPPTNASDFDSNSQSSSRSVSSASPPQHRNATSKSSRSPIHKRHTKSSSVSSSGSVRSPRYLKQEVTDLARKYRLYYPKYEALYRELSGMSGARDKVKERDLLEMHARLESMKKEILEGVVEGDSEG